MLRITLVLTLLLTALPASAMTIGTLKELQNSDRSDPAYKSYMLGLQRGIMYTDGVVEQRFGESLFCLPEAMNFGSIDYAKMTLEEAERMGMGDDAVAEMVMIFALMTNFPCE